MSAQKTNAKRNGTAAGTGEAEKMDKVREILFGHELREIETKLGNTEADLQQQLDELTKLAKKRMDDLEAKLGSQHKSLLREISTFDSSHSGISEKAANERAKLIDRVEKNRAEAKQEVRALRTHVNEQVKVLNAALKAQAKQLGDHFTAEIASLSERSVDRMVLAAMFEEFAATLAGEEE